MPKKTTPPEKRAYPRGFAADLIAWQRAHGRHDLPWQNTRDAYAIWVSEIMLQQTQVAAVIPYYARFMARFPDVRRLAAAPMDDVLALWSGLGYYSRARNLHAAAQAIVARHGGDFPKRFDDVVALPGIGRSTAAAILVFSTGARHAILDGNVKRVLARCLAVPGFPGDASVLNELWAAAEALLPQQDVEAYTQGLMDLGATLCTRTRPRCTECPVAGHCVARAEARVSEFPAPRPRKQIPARETIMLLVEHEGALLLERRPPAGIWGGLWSLPEAAVAVEPADWCRKQLGVQSAELRALPPLEHGFTHFRLTIRPYHVRVGTKPVMAAENTHTWATPDMIAGLGLPAPVKTLVAQIGILGDEMPLFANKVA